MEIITDLIIFIIGLTIGCAIILAAWQHDPQAITVVWRWLLPYKPMGE